MDWQYPWQDATELSSKFAISHLAEEVGEVEKPRFAARPAYLYKQGLTPAEKGSAMHTYMQFCSYPAAARDADAELERLMADRFLTEEQGAAIETDRIRTFFESPLYRRISGSPAGVAGVPLPGGDRGGGACRSGRCRAGGEPYHRPGRSRPHL